MILSIETSTAVCSVALHQNGELLATTELVGEKSHARYLTLLIENMLAHSQVAFADLKALAVSQGPGSYTGLRIGVSVAKGLCYALKIPLLAVDTLQVMAAQIALIDPKSLLCPMLDARRMEVYTAIFRNQELIMPTQALILDDKSFLDFLEKEKIYFFGNGSNKFREICTHPNAHFVEKIYPCAKFVGKIAHQNPQEVDVAYFEPFYLKAFQGTIPKSLLRQN